MKHSLLVILLSILLSSCEKTYYSTSISIKNELSDTINVVLYPIEKPFQFRENLTVYPGYSESLYGRDRTDLSILTILSTVFDSILVFKMHEDFKIKFSPDTSINCNFNPYNDISNWEMEIIEGDEPTSFTSTHVITENHYFRISDTNISVK